MAQVNNPKGINQYTKGGRAKAGTLSTYQKPQLNAFQGPPMASNAGAGRGNINPPNVDRFASAGQKGMIAGAKLENKIRSTAAGVKAFKDAGILGNTKDRMMAAYMANSFIKAAGPELSKSLPFDINHPDLDTSFKGKVRILKDETRKALGDAKLAMNRADLNSAERDPKTSKGGKLGESIGRKTANAKESGMILKTNIVSRLKRK